jgi:hypothetical protein
MPSKRDDCIKAGWVSVKTAEWREPTIGKKWVREDDAPSAGGDGPTADASRVVLLSWRDEKRFAMTSNFGGSRVGVLLIALVLTIAPPVLPVHAVEDARKVSVVSFGLFGDQGVFRNEATSAAQVVADRFRSSFIKVQFNSKKGGGATIEGLAKSLQLAANGMDPENDILFLILTSHGSPTGLAVKAGRRTQTLTPSTLANMLARTGVRHKVVVISACYSGVFISRLARPDVLVITAADADHSSFGCEDKAKWTYFGDAFFKPKT